MLCVTTTADSVTRCSTMEAQHNAPFRAQCAPSARSMEVWNPKYFTEPKFVRRKIDEWFNDPIMQISSWSIACQWTPKKWEINLNFTKCACPICFQKSVLKQSNTAIGETTPLWCHNGHWYYHNTSLRSWFPARCRGPGYLDFVPSQTCVHCAVQQSINFRRKLKL